MEAPVRHLLKTALIAFGLLAIANAAMADRAAAGEAESAGDCVGVSRTEAGDGLVFEIQNGCDRKLACEMTWNLKCGEKPATLTERGQEKFAISADASHSVAATATACGNRSWRIDNVQWACSGK
jgi:hypothetical protein